MSRTIEVAGAVRESFTGELIGPADPAYERARRVHNGLIDKRPALIARCRTVPDVVDAVNIGREQSAEISVRGGGEGWLMGKYGLTIDNLLAAEVVTAAGEIVTASAGQNQDLFWALRGGGGNFGVVTAFLYRAHPVTAVYGGVVAHPVSRAREAFRFYRDLTRSAHLPAQPQHRPIGVRAMTRPAPCQERDPIVTSTHFTAEPGVPQVVITREFAAPRELLFRAHTDPDLLVQWLAPGQLIMTVDRFELRDGGPWRYQHWEADGTDYAFHGVFHGEPSPDGMVQTFEAEGRPGHVSLWTVTFSEHGDKTLLSHNAVYQSVADRDLGLQSGMEASVSGSMDRLEELLARLVPVRR